MFKHGFPKGWTTLKKLIWLRASGAIGAAWHTVTGAIVTFVTSLTKPLRLTAELEPIQDLHGYDAPWPAGGGKNVFPYPVAKDETFSDVHFVSDGKGKITVTGTASGNTACSFALVDSFIIPNGQQYKVCFLNSEAKGTVQFKNGATAIDSWGLNTVNRSSNYTQMSGNECDSIVVSVNSGDVLNLTLQIMLVANSDETTTYISYSNICPITGHTGCEVHVADGENPHVVENEYDISWQSVAGTVYSGSLSINEDGSGVLTAMNQYYTADGDEAWSLGGYNNFRLSITGKATVSYDELGVIACDKLKPIKFNDRGITTVPDIMSSDSDYIEVRNMNGLGISTLDEFKTWLASNNISFVYPLATPITYTLTAEQVGQINTLQGTNNVWVDDSDEITVEYRA